ncbi:hypothetical protein BU15DRAFT_69053 [Melanogaster broomeanus]|nr:hypothetical protein BU15DRAFT_69053 [Melanogaster broomeanus]
MGVPTLLDGEARLLQPLLATIPLSLPSPTETEFEFLWRGLHSNYHMQSSLEDIHALATTLEYVIALIDMELRALTEFVLWIQHPDTNYNSTIIPSLMQGPNLLSAPPHPPPQSPPPTPDDISSPSTTSSGSQEYQCWWLPEGGSLTDDICGETFPDRLAFLRHLAAAHNVSGSSAHLITCRFVDPETGSFCGMQFKRGNIISSHREIRGSFPSIAP